MQDMNTSEKDEYFDIPKNYQDFVLVQKTNVQPADYGYTKEAVMRLLDMIKNDSNNYELEDDEIQNTLAVSSSTVYAWRRMWSLPSSGLPSLPI